jgi:hypothetical protein
MHIDNRDDTMRLPRVDVPPDGGPSPLAMTDMVPHYLRWVETVIARPPLAAVAISKNGADGTRARLPRYT